MSENTEMNKSKYKLEAGRPESCEGRLEKEVRVYDFLDELGLEYYRTDHPDAEAYTMEACREIDAVLGATVCKNLVLTNRQHTDYYLLLMPGDDLIVKNPFEFELGTVIVNDSEKREALSVKDEARFLNFVKEDKHYSKYYDGFFILFKTGLRISEFCGITVRDLDFDNDVINIDHQLQRTRDMKYVVESTKTSSGTRKLPMTPEVREAFLRILSNRKKPKREPIVDGHGGFLFLDKNEKPMVALHWQKYMKFARDKYNRNHPLQLPPITPHICRHTYCSNMAKMGISPKTLQYLMGHSDIGVTLNVYTHLGLEDAKAEIERLLEAKNEMQKQNYPEKPAQKSKKQPSSQLKYKLSL